MTGCVDADDGWISVKYQKVTSHVHHADLGELRRESLESEDRDRERLYERRRCERERDLDRRERLMAFSLTLFQTSRKMYYEECPLANRMKSSSACSSHPCSSRVALLAAKNTCPAFSDCCMDTARSAPRWLAAHLDWPAQAQCSRWHPAQWPGMAGRRP